MKGKVFKYKDNVNTDEIIPARYLNTTNPDELAKYCMEDIDVEFVKKVQKGDVIIAGKNFGCGSSREHAPIAIKASGVSCVIASTFARIFYRNAFNIGLPVLECDCVDEIDNGDILEVILSKGLIKNLTKGKSYNALPIPDFMQEIINAGGLMEYVRKKEGK